MDSKKHTHTSTDLATTSLTEELYYDGVCTTYFHDGYIYKIYTNKEGKVIKTTTTVPGVWQ